MYKTAISIIMPAYNAEKYLRETLDSIINQSFENYEIILINDGSKDGTQKIIDEYQARYSDKICAYSQENRGQSATRNRALEYVQGKYIAFVDADDILKKDYLETLYSACEKEQADIAIGGYKKFVSGRDEIVYSRNAKDWDVEFDEGIHHVFQYSPCGKLYLTKFIMDHGFVFSEGEQLEDGPYGVMTHIVADKVVVLPYQGYLYRIHSESTMGNVRKKEAKPKVPYRGIETAIKQVRKYKKDPTTDKVLEYCIIKVLAGLTTNMYKSCDKETRKKVCRYCYYILGKYFPEARHNQYTKVFRLKKIPFVHRMAVKLFLIAYRLHVLFPFSLVVSKFIKE
ncbi:MAG: glycosyltransferase family 2 protein [Eubacteriales bacterium]|nr:glycosyltransferase family 2 protein [Eubacteriales bacterium]